MNKKYIIYLVIVTVIIAVVVFFFDMYQFAKGVENDIDKNNKFKDSTNIIFYKDSIGNYKMANKDSIYSSGIKVKQKHFDYRLLNGVWAENEEDNALFQIENDTLRYVEYYDTPYLVSLKENHLLIKYLDNKVLSESEILKITRDSLILKTDEIEPLKLFNRSK